MNKLTIKAILDQHLIFNDILNKSLISAKYPQNYDKLKMVSILSVIQ